MMRKEIIWQEEILDDRVCRAVLPVSHVFHQTGFGLDREIISAGDTGAYAIKSVLTDYDDLPKLTYRSIEIDYKKTDKLLEVAHDVFDGILEVQLENAWWFSHGLTVDAIHLRGFENFLTDMYENPEELHALMQFLSEDTANLLDFLAQNSLLSLNNGGEFMGTGGYGWCDELPGSPFDPLKVAPQNMWGYGESQETIYVSPKDFDEFVLRYQLPLLSQFGLNAYGCCEPLDDRLDLLIEKIPNLRKITISPWSDVNKMAERLGKDYVYCWKMNPSYIATKEIFEDNIRSTAHEAFSAAFKNGCPAEVLMRDVRTLAGKKENATRWVELVREESARLYG